MFLGDIYASGPGPKWDTGPSGPGPKWARAQVGPGPKWARAQVGPGPKWARGSSGTQTWFKFYVFPAGSCLKLLEVVWLAVWFGVG